MGISKGSAQSSLLSENFYENSCPNVEAIVKNAVDQKFKETDVTVPGTLRLFFHDCFVEGCDGSVIIQSTPDNKAEKDSEDNLSLEGDGFDTVIRAKQAVEAECPNTVSCADILTIAARDVLALVGGPGFNVELGRRDGTISQAARVAGNLPKATFNFDQLLSLFQKKGLTQTDLVALSGVHTLGFAHCDQFSSRYTSNPIDPSLNKQYAKQLQQICNSNRDPDFVVGLDPTTPRHFDNNYYQNLVAGKGLLSSDEALISDQRSKSTVISFSRNSSVFFAAFAEAIKKLGRTDVKTGSQGEIRRDCSRFNKQVY
ncbi:hypothetical protein SUGI_0577190 [Cryptomeria japonica]|nr:hypothetical protein SUGI_0577190 [Cryptomeria japonica]